MDLNTIEQVVRPTDRMPVPEPGDAFLAGGTWLFSEPQVHLRRLIDLASLRWPAIEADPDGVCIAATCTLDELERYFAATDWPATDAIVRCCHALLGSFKVRRAATVGGNLCLALPAAPMAALAVAMDGVCTIWCSGGATRLLPARDLITGANRTSLASGEVLRSVRLDAAALARRYAFRQTSLTPLGRSAALLIGAREGAGTRLTITASVDRPIAVRLPALPSPDAVHEAIDHAVPAWLDDVHGAPVWRRRITHAMAAEIVTELGDR